MAISESQFLAVRAAVPIWMLSEYFKHSLKLSSVTPPPINKLQLVLTLAISPNAAKP
jgi:hypothetical protein